MVTIWDLDVRVGLALSLAAAVALLADAKEPVRICTWLALMQVAWSVAVSAPALRLDIHWRSLLLYILNITLSVICIVEVATGRDEVYSAAFRIGYGVTMILTCLLTAGIYYYLPTPARSLLTGTHKCVGTTSFNVPDSGDIAGAITIQCWFPVTKAQSAPALLWTSGHPSHQLKESLDMLDTLAGNNKLPAFAVKHLTLMRTNSHWQSDFQALAAPVGSQKYPIAIYSHGLYGWRQIHHSACESLASAGFIVFACDHTPDSMCSRPLGGPASKFAFPTPPDLEPDVERKFFQGGMERRIAQLTKIVTHLQSEPFVKEHAQLAGKLDFQNIHMWGHSYGGGTISALCCRELPFQIRSAVMLDGWIYPVPDADRKVGFRNAALLNLSAELWPFGKYQFPFREDLAQNTVPVSQALRPLDLVIRGSDHQNFVDIHLIARNSLLERPAMLGPSLSAAATVRAIDDILPAYFMGVSACHAQGTVADTKHPESDDATLSAEHVDVAVPTTAVPHPSVQALLGLCNAHCDAHGSEAPRSALQKETAAFIRLHVVHVSQLPASHSDARAFDRVVSAMNSTESEAVAAENH